MNRIKKLFQALYASRHKLFVVLIIALIIPIFQNCSAGGFSSNSNSTLEGGALGGTGSIGDIADTGGKALGKDLFVAMNGNDSVSYADNSIDAPWATVAKGIYSLKAGDVLHIRGGEYVQNYPLTIHSQYRNNNCCNPLVVMEAESGTAEKPIVVKNYNNEVVTINLATVETFLNIDGKEYWTFDGLTFINTGVVFRIGQDKKTHHNTFRNLKIYGNRAEGNSGLIYIYNSNAEYTVIENNILQGEGEVGSDVGKPTSCVYARRVRHLKILNNECKNTLLGMYYKHRTFNQMESGDSEPVDIEIAYNFIENTRRASMYLNTNEAYIHDNLIGRNNAGLINAEASGDAGGDFNRYEHNTFYSGGLGLLTDTQDYEFNGIVYKDQYPGSRYNILKNNIFVRDLGLHWYSTDLPHNTTSNYNLFPEAMAVSANRIQYFTLSSWQLASQSDANSLQGSPVFVGGSAPGKISDFALSATSPGYKKGSDGKNMGAQIDKVGVAR